MRFRTGLIFSMFLAMTLCFAGVVQADDILADDGFEGTLGNWYVTNSAALFTWSGNTNDPNYATTGFGAGQIPRTCGDPALVLIEPLQLATFEYTNVTWVFHWQGAGGGGTVRWNFQYSEDGGTNWVTLHQVLGTNTAPAYYSNTLNIASYNFTDNFKFRILGGCQSPTHNLYADNMQIIASPTPPPRGTVISLF